MILQGTTTYIPKMVMISKSIALLRQEKPGMEAQPMAIILTIVGIIPMLKTVIEM